MRVELYFLICLAFFSCGQEDQKVHVVESVQDSLKHQDTLSVKTEEEFQIKDPMIVTPEHWKDFSTEIKAAVFFTDKEKLEEHLEELIHSVEENVQSPDLSYYQVYSPDTASFVFLNDSLLFDFTAFKLKHQEGYFLIQPGNDPHSFELKDDVDYIAGEIKGYFN